MMEISTNTSPDNPPAAGGSRGDNFSPVTVHQEDTIGAIFLGIVSIALFVALMRAEARNRALTARLAGGRG
jgi:hypothetical protein